MNKNFAKLALVAICLALFPDRVFAEGGGAAAPTMYPQTAYIMGIGEAPKSGNREKDKRTAQIKARLDLAKQIRVHVSSKAIDMMCEGRGQGLYRTGEECRNGIAEAVEITVDISLEGTRIVNEGERGNMVYAIAVLDRMESGERMEERQRDAVDQAKESLGKAKAGDKEAMRQARQEYRKAIAYERGKEAIAGIRSREAGMMDELGKDILKVESKLAGAEWTTP